MAEPLILNPLEALFNPTPYQQEVLVSKAKMKVLLNGRQSGKSTVLRMLMYKDAWEQPNRELMYVAKSIKQAKDIMWRSLTKGFTPIFPPQCVLEVNNVDHYIVLTNGTRITVTGSENVDNLLGKTCDKLYLDEWQSHSHQDHVWTLLQPMLAARNGDVVFAGTARGFDDLYDKCQMGDPSSTTKKAGWRSWHIPTSRSGTPAGTPQAIALAKSTLSAHQFAQEYEASPYATTGLVYCDFDPDHNISDRISINPIVDGEVTEPTLHIGMDFNVDNMSAVVAVKIGKVLHIVDEIIQGTNSNTITMATEIKKRYGHRNLIIYPDASGRNRNQETGGSNHKLLKGAPYNFPLKFSHSGNPLITNRINVCNSVMCNAVGVRRLLIHPRCESLLKTLTRQTYDKNGAPEKQSGLDHAGDAFGYVLYYLYKQMGSTSISVGTF